MSGSGKPEKPSDNDQIKDTDPSETELLEILKSLSPGGFERVCQRLLREAGFEQVMVTGKSSDGGIDGHYNGPQNLNHLLSDI
jgi:restriction system protein